MEAKPDTVVYSNGRIVDGRRHILNGHLITQGAAIIAVGSGEPKRAVSPGSVRHVDLAGRTLLPGFIDCHVHFTMNADAAPTPIVSPVDQMVALIRASINALNTLPGAAPPVRDSAPTHSTTLPLHPPP